MNSHPPICRFASDEIFYRGHAVESLIGNTTFIETILLLLTGVMPEPHDLRGRMIDALLVAWADHGEPPPSTQAVRLAASVGTPFIQSAVSALSMFGWDHAPVDAAIKLLAECTKEPDQIEIPKERIKRGEKIPGFGHPVHSKDPRAERLLDLSRTLGFGGNATECLFLIEGEIAHPVSANLAGATAAIWLDMGFRPESVGVIALAGRAIGLAAHHSEVVRAGSKFIGTP